MGSAIEHPTDNRNAVVDTVVDGPLESGYHTPMMPIPLVMNSWVESERFDVGQGSLNEVISNAHYSSFVITRAHSSL